MPDSSRPRLTSNPPHRATAVPDATRPRVRLWELQRAVPDYVQGARFAKMEGRPGVIVSFSISEDEFARLLTEHPELMQFISDSHRPPGRHLRALP